MVTPLLGIGCLCPRLRQIGHDLFPLLCPFVIGCSSCLRELLECLCRGACKVASETGRIVELDRQFHDGVMRLFELGPEAHNLIEERLDDAILPLAGHVPLNSARHPAKKGVRLFT